MFLLIKCKVVIYLITFLRHLGGGAAACERSEPWPSAAQPWPQARPKRLCR